MEIGSFQCDIDCFSRTKKWSRPEILSTFNTVYKRHFVCHGIETAKLFSSHKSGVSEISTCKLLLWESSSSSYGTYICLQEVDTTYDLEDNRICIRLGNAREDCEQGEEVLGLFVDSKNENGCLSVRISVLLSNGNVSCLDLFSKSPKVSFLQYLVLARDGDLLSLINGQLVINNDNSSVHSLSGCRFCGSTSMKSTNDNRLLSVTWISASTFVVGLSAGFVGWIEVLCPSFSLGGRLDLKENIRRVFPLHSESSLSLSQSWMRFIGGKTSSSSVGDVDSSSSSSVSDVLVTCCVPSSSSDDDGSSFLLTRMGNIVLVSNSSTFQQTIIQTDLNKCLSQAGQSLFTHLLPFSDKLRRDPRSLQIGSDRLLCRGMARCNASGSMLALSIQMYSFSEEEGLLLLDQQQSSSEEKMWCVLLLSIDNNQIHLVGSPIIYPSSSSSSSHHKNLTDMCFSSDGNNLLCLWGNKLVVTNIQSSSSSSSSSSCWGLQQQEVGDKEKYQEGIEEMLDRLIFEEIKKDDEDEEQLKCLFLRRIFSPKRFSSQTIRTSCQRMMDLFLHPLSSSHHDIVILIYDLLQQPQPPQQMMMLCEIVMSLCEVVSIVSSKNLFDVFVLFLDLCKEANQYSYSFDEHTETQGALFCPSSSSSSICWIGRRGGVVSFCRHHHHIQQQQQEDVLLELEQVIGMETLLCLSRHLQTIVSSSSSSSSLLIEEELLFHPMLVETVDKVIRSCSSVSLSRLLPILISNNNNNNNNNNHNNLSSSSTTHPHHHHLSSCELQLLETVSDVLVNHSLHMNLITLIVTMATMDPSTTTRRRRDNMDELLHTSALKWMRDNRPVKNFQLKSRAELSALFPLMRSSRPSIDDNRRGGGVVVIPCDEELSLLHNLWSSSCSSNHHLEVVIEMCWSSSSSSKEEEENWIQLRNHVANILCLSSSSSLPSMDNIINMDSSISLFLMKHHQFKGLFVWSRVQEELQQSQQMRRSSSSSSSSLSVLADKLLLVRIGCVKLLSQFFEVLRCFVTNNNNKDDSSYSQQQQQWMAIVSQLFQSLDQLLTRHLHDDDDVVWIEELQSMCEEEEEEDEEEEKLSISQTSILKDMCLSSRWMSMCLSRHRRNRRYLKVLKELCRIDCFKDVLEVLERCASIAPHPMQIVELAIQYNVKYVDLLRSFMDKLFHPSISKNLSSSSEEEEEQQLGKFLFEEICSGSLRLFENYLLHDNRFQEALSTVFDIADLFNSDDDYHPTDTIAMSEMMGWRRCLNALVDKACEKGHLQWLCRQGHRDRRHHPELGGGGGGGELSLYSFISLELESLAFGSDIEKQLHGRQTTPNYYECLFAYLFHHHNYRDASLVMFRCFDRLQSMDSFIQIYKVGVLSISIHSLQCVPLEQTFLLQRIETSVVCLIDRNHLSLLFLYFSALKKLSEEDLLQTTTLSRCRPSFEKICRYLCFYGFHGHAFQLSLLVKQISSSSSSSSVMALQQIDQNCSMDSSSLSLPELVLFLSNHNQQSPSSSHHLEDLLLSSSSHVNFTGLDGLSDEKCEVFHRQFYWNDLLQRLDEMSSSSSSLFAIRLLQVAMMSCREEEESIPLRIIRHHHPLSSSFSLMQIFLRFGRLEEACDLASEVVSNNNKEEEEWISYAILDEVIERCQKQLQSTTSIDKNDNCCNRQLFRKLNRLKSLLEKHFLSLIIENV